MFKKQCLVVILLVFLSIGCSSSHLKLPLKPLYKPHNASYTSEKRYPCREPNLMPYTSDLLFHSKYEGSGKDRATLNEEASRNYKTQTKTIRAFEKQLSKLSSVYVKHNYKASSVAQCFITTLLPWAEKQALLSDRTTHTGASVRKWALASVVANMNVVRSSLDFENDKTQTILAWVEAVTIKVMKEWQDRPLKKVNNHDYWAAWAVMSSAVLLNNEDFFLWSVGKYNEAMIQIDSEGFLPNELKRKSRALGYHNYALTPLLFIADLAAINGYELDNVSLMRLADNVIKGLDDPEFFSKKVGKAQRLEGLYTSYSLAWIPIYLVNNSNTIVFALVSEHGPFASTRLGGNISLQLAERI
jgi:poly(beta-D-mannuronate) lyase